MTETDRPLPSRSRGVQSVDTAARLLRILLQAEQPMMLRDLADLADLKSAQAHAYLNSLKKAGLVQQLGPAGRYALAQECLHLSHAGLATHPGFASAVKAARHLTAETGRMVTVDLWVRGAPTIVFLAPGEQSLSLSLREGLQNDLTNSASAWVFAAFAEASPSDPAVCAMIRTKGYALIDGVPLPHMASLAVPVPAGDQVTAVVSMIGYPDEIKADREAALDLIRACLAAQHQEVPDGP